VISPRQAGTVPAPPGGTGTAAMRFYEQFSTAYHARDFAQVGAMCQPDVVVLLPSISGVLAGRESTLAEFRKAARRAERTRREAVVSYLEAPGVFCVEDQTAQGTGRPGVWDRRLEYEVLIMRE
jgi:hypothetical protein